jgi:hypothetical protein
LTVREHDADLGRVDVEPFASGKESNAENQQVAKEVETDAEPALDGDGPVERISTRGYMILIENRTNM